MASNQKLNYFKLSEDSVIFPSKTSSRIFARLIDFFIAILIPMLITMIYYQVQISNDDTWYPKPYNWSFLLSNIFAIIFVLSISLIYPIFNIKNPGQTIGKKALGITPIFLNSPNEKLSIFIREIPLSIFYCLPIFIKLISGWEISQILSIYSKQTGESVAMFDFIYNIWLNESIIGLDPLFMWQAIMITIYWSLGFIDIFIVIILLFSVLSNTQKIGLHDKLSKTAVVNLSTFKSEKEALEEHERWNGNSNN